MLGLFLIHALFWCIKGSFVFNYTYPCINKPSYTMVIVIILNMIVLLIHVLVIHRLKILPNKRFNNTMISTCIIFSNTSY